MDYHQNARLTVIGREQLARRVLHQGLTLKQAATDFNVSAKTAAKWTSRFEQGGVAALYDRSSRPRRSPRQTSSTFIEKVLALRRLRQNGWRIARELKLSRATVSRILRRAGMNRLRSLDPPPPVVRYEHKRPGDLIHFDIKRLARIVKPGTASMATAPAKLAALATSICISPSDDHTRLAFTAILPDQTSRSAQLFFHMSRAYFSRFGLGIRRVLTDNGSCYRDGHFQMLLNRQHIRQRFTRPYTHAPTEKPNASSKPLSANGPTPAPIKTQKKEKSNSIFGSTTTTSTAHMLASISTHRSAAQASIGTTS